MLAPFRNKIAKYFEWPIKKNTSQETALNYIKIKIFLVLEISTFLYLSVKFFTEMQTYHRQHTPLKKKIFGLICILKNK